jgi:hypothetical protein
MTYKRVAVKELEIVSPLQVGWLNRRLSETSKTWREKNVG